MNTPIDKRVTNLILRLEKLKRDLEPIHYIYNKKEFFSFMWEMWDFFKNYNDIKAYELFSNTDKFTEYQIFFTEKDEYFEKAIDLSEALNILAKNTDIDLVNTLDNNFSKNVFLQTQNEINAISSETIKTLIMVGCGFTPETILYIAQNTNIENIIGLDYDPEVISIAREVIHKMGFDEKVTLKQAYGDEYNYKDADCIHMANFIRGKKETLNQISKTAKDGCTIIARQANLLSNLVYEEIYPKLHNRLIIKDLIQGCFYNFYIFKVGENV